MYKTNYRLSIVLAADSAISAFEDSQAHPGAATAALAQIKSCRDVDSVGEEVNIIIPYHAIDYVVVEATRSEESDPVDDNCNTGDPAEPGTLKIVNASGEVLSDVVVNIDAEIEGTYGDLTFAIDAESTPEYPLSTATIATLADGATVTATGLPDGVTLEVSSDAGSYQGTVPCTITLTGEHPGPK